MKTVVKQQEQPKKANQIMLKDVLDGAGEPLFDKQLIDKIEEAGRISGNPVANLEQLADLVLANQLNVSHIKAGPALYMFTRDEADLLLRTVWFAPELVDHQIHKRGYSVVADNPYTVVVEAEETQVTNTQQGRSLWSRFWSPFQPG